jgi:GNAT superfamily N-acetyltransferase
VRIRRAQDDDLPELARIFTRSVTQLVQLYRPEQLEHLPDDTAGRLRTYTHLLETGVIFVAEDPQPAGFAAAVVRDGVWFLSQLWVLPERQGQGIGAALLDEGLAWGRGSRVFSVIASPHPAAQLLYLRASMYPLWLQLDLTGSGRVETDPPSGIQALGPGDRSWLEELDREIRGTVRPEDHTFWAREARGIALWRDGQPRGYLYLWPEGNEGKAGPGAVRDPSDTSLLIRAGLHLAGGPVTFAVPSVNWSALGELVSLGFVPTGSNGFLASRPIGDGSRYLSSGGALG